MTSGKDNREYLRAELGQNCIKERDKYKHVGIWVTTNGTIQWELEDKLAKGKRRILACASYGWQASKNSTYSSLQGLLGK